MPASIKNITTADAYSVGATVTWPNTRSILVQIANASVLVELDQSAIGDGDWGPELQLLPTVGILQVVGGGIRFRSAVAGTPAVVSCTLFNADEAPQPGSLSPFTSRVDAAGLVTQIVVPTGTVLAFAGSVAPAGYVLCDGSLYDGTNASYAALWGVIGLTYGGSGQSSFAVPDLRGRMIAGRAPTGNVDVQTLGLNDGVALANRRPKHRHTVIDPGHTHQVNIGTGNIGVAGDTVVQGNSPPSSLEPRARTNTTGITVGAAADSLDAPPYLVLNQIIAL